MAYFAQLDSDGTVLRVISVSNSDAPDPAPSYSESLGQAFIATLAQNDHTLAGEWRQTSYNGSFRKQFAGIGGRYDANADVFVAPQPHPSWTLDENHDWQPPTPMPTEGFWYWNESNLAWVEVGP